MMMSLDCLINEVDVQATIERDDFEKDGVCGCVFVGVCVYVGVCVCVCVCVCVSATHHTTPNPQPPTPNPQPPTPHPGRRR